VEGIDGPPRQAEFSMAGSKSGRPETVGVRRVEGSTLFVASLIYSGWIALTLCATRLPLWIVAPFGGWLIAWHGSLQHETIHGHPTPWPWVNRLLGFAPLSLWLPYGRYERLHLAHHGAEHLTFPGLDSEARYLSRTSGLLARTAAWATATLAGRLLLGPPIEIAAFLVSEAKALAAGEPGVRRAWAIHLAGAAAIWAWLRWACGFGLADYLAAFVYPGAALLLLRSFAEHRADADPGRRVAIVENAPVFGLLFLNNNLHAVHHAFPGAPWSRLPELYAEHRTALLQRNGGLVYRGYAEVVRRFLFRPHDVLVHPAERQPTRLEQAAP
jgi:fatty acid desaturase